MCRREQRPPEPRGRIVGRGRGMPCVRRATQTRRPASGPCCGGVVVASCDDTGGAPSMHAHEISSAVRRSARIDTPEHADAAVRATLTVLGRRVLPTDADDLAAQLPGEYAVCLHSDAEVERFGLGEFYRWV